MEGILEELLEGSGWTTDGFGDYDSCLVCEADGTMIEMDTPKCPECGRRNPVMALGLI